MEKDIDKAAINVSDLVPDKCLNCPVQCSTSRELLELLINQSALSDVGSSLVGEEGQIFNEFIDSVVDSDDEVADSLKVGIRRTMGQELSDVDEKIEALKLKKRLFSQTCIGQLTMRASKNGRTYLATLCTSSEVNELNEQMHVPAHVKTKRTLF